MLLGDCSKLIRQRRLQTTDIPRLTVRFRNDGNMLSCILFVARRFSELLNPETDLSYRASMFFGEIGRIHVAGVALMSDFDKSNRRR